MTGWLGLWWALRPALRQAPQLLLPLDLCGPRLWNCLLKWRCVCARLLLTAPRLSVMNMPLVRAVWMIVCGAGRLHSPPPSPPTSVLPSHPNHPTLSL